MKLENLNESSWEDAGIKDPNKKPVITNLGYLLQCMVRGLNENEWSYKANYTVNGVEAEVMDKRTGIFYHVQIKPIE